MGNKYSAFNYAPEMYDKDKWLVESLHSKVPYLGKSRIQDVYELAKILKEYGYKGLRVASNQSSNSFMPLDKLANINPERIIRVAQDMYFQANKRMNIIGNPLRNPKSPFYKKIPSLEEKVEANGQMCLF